MHFTILRAVAALGACLPFASHAGASVDVEILDRKTGQVLPVYWHDGERHVVGEPGREYEIRVRNRNGGRMLAVTSVDGINVITGKTAAPAQSGYVLDPWGLVDIDGWRKSLDQVAAFYFTALPDSYAARSGRPGNVGVIGVALFREREVIPLHRDDYGWLDRPASAPAAEASAESKASGSSGHARREERLGTGHGQRLDSGATYTHFERATEAPEEIIRIYYDSRKNLVARGIIPRPWYRFAWQQPDPFPEDFVPDP